jgi:hypothetical protein
MQPGPQAAVVGVSAVSAFGFGWRGLGRALLGRALAPRPCATLERSHPGTWASEVPPVPAADEVSDAKTRRLMSRAAHLAALAMKRALADAGWDGGRDEVGCFLGVGASGGPMEELLAILRASVVGGKVDPARFCREGLASAHPLLAFHLLSNYILCHGSIATGVGGPNRAFYSRGTGTVTAVAEACWRWPKATARARPRRRRGLGPAPGLVRGAAPGRLHRARVRAGGRRGAARPRAPADTALAWIDGCAVDRDLDSLLRRLAPPRRPRHPGSLGPARPRIAERGPRRRPPRPPNPRARPVPVAGRPARGGPALACAAAVDLLVSGTATQALVLCAGVDGAFGGVVLSRGPR